MTDRSPEHRAGEAAGSSIDDIRARFAAKWESDPPPQIETFLGEADPTDRQRLFAELLAVSSVPVASRLLPDRLPPG